MIDDRLCITDQILSELKQMRNGGATAEQIIAHAKQAGVPKGAVTVALRLSGVMSLRNAKMAVHYSEAYASSREQSEVFEQSIFDALKQIEQAEQSLTAA